MKKEYNFTLISVIASGILLGVGGVILEKSGNPFRTGICVSCFVENIAGSLGLHANSRMQYIRPEVIGFILGAFILSLLRSEFNVRGGQSPVIRFVLGILMMIGASGDIYKNILGPIRHNLRLLAVIPLGYVYVKELSIERTIAENKIKEENEISSSLLKTFDILNSSLEIKQIINNVIVVAPKYLKFDKLIIFLYGQETNEIICSYSYGFDPEEKTLTETSFKNNGIQVKLGIEPIIINDANKYELLSKDFANTLNIHNAVMMPIIISGHLEALLIGGYKNIQPVSTYDLSF